MGNGNGSACLDLAAEQRNHGAVRAQHVAEACGDKLGLAALTGMILHDHLTTALGRAHDVGGIDRLIGGDHDKSLYPVFFSKIDHVERAEDIVLNRFGRRNLHQRNMFMRRRVEHDLRLILGKDAVHLRVITHGRDQSDQIQTVAVLDVQLLLDIIGVVFVDIHDNDPFGMVLSDLAHQL